jgi:RNA ligase (TIGR02306 family)
MRKLVTLRSISTISQIAGAETIECAVLDGWECVIRKSEGLKPGDVVVYIETDAFLKVKEPFLDLHKVQGCLQKNAENEEGFKIRIHQMGPKKTPENDALGYVKQTSNGLVLPLSDFETIVPGIRDMPVGTDLTEQIGAKVFEPFVAGEVENIAFGGMSSAIKETDQERVQNALVYFSKYRGITFEVTEKINGTSCSFYLMDGKFGVCNRTLDLKNTPGCKHWDYAIARGIEQAMREHGKNIALQGELAGEGIAKNTLQLKGVHYFLFDVWDIDERRYMTATERKAVFGWFKAKCGIEHVPVVDKAATLDPEGSISRAQSQIARLELERDTTKMDKAEFDKKRTELSVPIHEGVKKFVAASDGTSVVTPGRKREGLVFKSNELVNGQTVSFKVISDAYKLKYEG